MKPLPLVDPDTATGRVRHPIFGAPCPALSAAEPASTEESGALDLPPRTQLLEPSGPSQLLHLAQERLHFLFVA
jgi:hypothetical protein